MQNSFVNEYGFDSNIIFLILSYLDCLGVVKLSLVCKNWYRSIRSAEFANFYSNFGPTPLSKILIQGVSPSDVLNGKKFLLISPLIEDKNNYTVLVPHADIGAEHDYELVGSIRGIICLQRWNQDGCCVFVICNPITGQKFETVSPARRTSSGEYLKLIIYHFKVM